MPENIYSTVMILLFVGIGVLAVVSILARTIKNRYAPVKAVKAVKAVVVDKHKIEAFTKYAGNGKNEKYVIVFFVDGKKKSFYASQFSYGGYRVNEKGVLKYKGDKLIEFK